MSAITAFTRLSGHQRIGGRLLASAGGGAIDVWDPATEQRIGQVAGLGLFGLVDSVASPYLVLSVFVHALQRTMSIRRLPPPMPRSAAGVTSIIIAGQSCCMRCRGR